MTVEQQDHGDLFHQVIELLQQDPGCYNVCALLHSWSPEDWQQIALEFPNLPARRVHDFRMKLDAKETTARAGECSNWGIAAGLGPSSRSHPIDDTDRPADSPAKTRCESG